MFGLSLKMKINFKMEPAVRPSIHPSDLVTGQAYAHRRTRLLERVAAARARRRVVLPEAVVLFESRETVIGHLQEIAFVEGRSSQRALAEEIAHYDRLVPDGNRITATLMVHGGPPEDGQALERALAEGGRAIELGIDDTWTRGALLGDAMPGCPVHYVGFDVPEPVLSALPAAREVAVRLYVGGRIRHRVLAPSLVAELVPDLTGAPV